MTFGDDTIELIRMYIFWEFCLTIKVVSDKKSSAHDSVKTAALTSLPFDIQCDMFDKLILPILLYLIEVWTKVRKNSDFFI